MIDLDLLSDLSGSDLLFFEAVEMRRKEIPDVLEESN